MDMRLTATVTFLSLILAVRGAGALAQSPSPGSDLTPVHATVVSVDRQHYTVDLRYATPGSAPVTRHTFALVNHNDVLRLRPGAVIDGTADTTQKVWTLSNVNVESDTPLKGQVGQ
jgi:hypothetical protein